MLGKWLAIITEKDIDDKTIIKNICEEQEEIGMAVSALVKWSEDVATRQAYQRRQDDIMLSKRRELDYEQKLEEKDTIILEQGKENGLLRKQLAELRSRLGE